MPEATKELRDAMTDRFGSIDTFGPERYLKEHGWTLSKTWLWTHPTATIWSCPREEFECILFLIREWDYGSDYPSETNAPD